jgi:hypothetical protein
MEPRTFAITAKKDAFNHAWFWRGMAVGCLPVYGYQHQHQLKCERLPEQRLLTKSLQTRLRGSHPGANGFALFTMSVR